MISRIPVRASRLHDRKLVVGATTIPRATLFPFFAESGRAERVLVVDADSSELLTFDLASARVSIPLWGTMRVDGPGRTLHDETLECLAPLWHFDPWWLLRDERFALDAAVPALKATNSVESFVRRPAEIWYSRRLDQIEWVVHAGGPDGTEAERFRPELLPMRTVSRFEKRRPRGRRRAWQLAPFWE